MGAGSVFVVVDGGRVFILWFLFGRPYRGEQAATRVRADNRSSVGCTESRFAATVNELASLVIAAVATKWHLRSGEWIDSERSEMIRTP
jgi:hypothetical protein